MEIVKYPTETLLQTSKRVEDFDASLASLADAMVETMYANNGVGLAAPQVGRNIRMIVVDPSSGHKKDSLLVLVNPVVMWRSKDESTQVEGCLSIPGMTRAIPRPSAVTIVYQTLTGAAHETTFVGPTARIIQHEIDHLDGILINSQKIKATSSSKTKEARA